MSIDISYIETLTFFPPNDPCNGSNYGKDYNNSGCYSAAITGPFNKESQVSEHIYLNTLNVKYIPDVCFNYTL